MKNAVGMAVWACILFCGTPLLMAGCRKQKAENEPSVVAQANDTLAHAEKKTLEGENNFKLPRKIWGDTLYVGKEHVYVCGHDENEVDRFIYDKDRVILEDPMLGYERIGGARSSKYRIWRMERVLAVDFSDTVSMARLCELNKMQPAYTRCREDCWKKNDSTFYAFRADLPQGQTQEA